MDASDIFNDHQNDQMMAMVVEQSLPQARLIAAYYQALIGCGVPEGVAERLAIAHQTTLDAWLWKK